MNVISLFQSLVNHLSNILENNLFLHDLEHNIFNSTNELNLDILKQILEYLDTKYELDKDPTIFVSGDGGPWIKGFDEAFPNAICLRSFPLF